MFKNLSEEFIDKTAERTEAIATMRNWRDLLPTQPNEFKQLTIDDFERISGECVARKKVEAKRELNRISTQINLAKFERAL